MNGRKWRGTGRGEKALGRAKARPYNVLLAAADGGDGGAGGEGRRQAAGVADGLVADVW
jgi:hypothetical protein